MAYRIDASENDCYPGSSVLINKRDLHDQAQLDTAESLIVSVKSLQFELEPFPGPLSFSYYQNLHHFSVL